MPFSLIKTISYPPRSNHSPLEGESKLQSNFGEGSEKQITNSNSSCVNSIYPSQSYFVALALPQGEGDLDRELQRGSNSDCARSNHSPLEGESKLHSNFGGGSEDYITNSNSSFVDNITYLSPKASPSTTPVKREGDADRELHRKKPTIHFN